LIASGIKGGSGLIFVSIYLLCVIEISLEAPFLIGAVDAHAEQPVQARNETGILQGEWRHRLAFPETARRVVADRSKSPERSAQEIRKERRRGRLLPRYLLFPEMIRLHCRYVSGTSAPPDDEIAGSACSPGLTPLCLVDVCLETPFLIGAVYAHAE
jgi:hypothetical protein